MKTHTIHLHAAPYAAISGGRKTIESRLYDAKRRQIALGDRLQFVNRDNPTETMSVRVVGLLRYQTFAELFTHREPTKFGRPNAEELLQEIRQFYSDADEAVDGVIGIEFDRL
jgi:ASC-1-like (ASCH) protein